MTATDRVPDAAKAGSSSHWRNRAVFVTGARGLLGGWLVAELLRSGARVVTLVRDEVPDSFFVTEGLADKCVVVRGEIAVLPLLERVLLEYEVDTIFHLAAQSQVGIARRGPYHTLESNIRGTYTLLEAARRTETVRAVAVASSDKAYGEQPRLPYTEDMPLLGTHPYDVSKAVTDLLARSYARTYHLPVVVTRCANLFGGGDLNWSRLVPGTVRSLIRGERPVIRSDGKAVRDYLYVKDAVAAYMLVAEQAPSLQGEAFNFSLETRLTVLEMVKMITAAADVDLKPDVRNTAVGEIQEQYLSSAKARAALGWKPLVSLEQGLRETVEWYRQHFARADRGLPA